jgi:hypothetical protein
MTEAQRAKAREQERRCRQRAREGMVRLAVWVDEVELIGRLRMSGWVEEHSRDPDKPELEKLLQLVVDTWLEVPAE